MKSRLWFLLAAIGAIGCGGYSADEEVTLGSAVYTQPAPNVNFTAFKTYYLDPKMEVWEDGAQDVVGQPVPSSTVTTIQQQMTKYGYTQQATPPTGNNLPNADVGLRLVFLQSNFTYYVSSGYCSVYWAYYACWPGWAYAGSYSTGTVLMMMVDTRTGQIAPAPDNATVWATALYAVLRGSSLENSNQLNSAIVRAYDQSPYLKNSP
ncbi:MAG: DUF4136 domain-containing protein [Myxococcales bacterium]